MYNKRKGHISWPTHKMYNKTVAVKIMAPRTICTSIKLVHPIINYSTLN